MDGQRHLEFNLKHTDYRQSFIANWSRDYQMNIVNQALALDLKYRQKSDQLSVLGRELSDARLNLTAVYQGNKARSTANADTQYIWRGYAARYKRVTGKLVFFI